MKDSEFDLTIPSHKFFHFARKKRHFKAARASGGIGIFVHHKICYGVDVFANHELISWIKLNAKSFNINKDIYIGCIYIPPEGSSYMAACDNYFDIIETEVMKFSANSDVFLCGDLNARTCDYDDFSNSISGTNSPFSSHEYFIQNDTSNFFKRSSQDQSRPNNYGKELLNICKSANLLICNGRFGQDKDIGKFTCFTARGRSVVDYLISSYSGVQYVQNFIVDSLRVESDHCPILYNLNIKHGIASSKKIVTGENITYYKWDKSRINKYFEQLTSDIACERLSHFLDQIKVYSSAETVCQDFYAYLEYAISNTFVKCKSHSTSCFPTNPWFDNECKELKTKAHNFTKENDLSVRENFIQYTALQKEYKKVVQRKKRLSLLNVRQKFENMLSNNPNDYWKFLKGLSRKSQTNDIDLQDLHDYFRETDSPPVLGYFDIHFMESINNLDLDEIDPEVDVEKILTTREILNQPIAEGELKIHLRKLKNHKASGTDGISAEFIKYAESLLLHPLLCLYNYILKSGDFPTQWSEGIINPLQKKGCKSDSPNYRKITVQVTLSKLFESIMNGRLQIKNTTFRDDDQFQAGFCNQSRTTDNMFILSSIIEKQKFFGKPLYVCFIDFTKAFDYINREALLYKLKQRGISGAFLNILRNRFNKSTVKVKWHGLLSEGFRNSSGVFQGGIMSPKLFNEFLSDIGESLRTDVGIYLDELLCCYLLYADDLVLFSDTEEGLQAQVNMLFQYCKKWHLIVSLSKTKIMVFNKRNCVPHIYFDNNLLEVVQQFKYLGFIIDSNAKQALKSTAPYLAEQARKALFSSLKMFYGNMGKPSPTCMIKLFDSQILPILEYGSELWATNKCFDVIESVHLRYLKRMLGVRSQTPTLGVYMETGRFPLRIRQQVRLVKYWLHILQLPVDHVLKYAYNTLLELYGAGQTNWCTAVANVLSKCNLDNHWISQHVENEYLFIRNLKETLYGDYMRECEYSLSIIDDKMKLRTYKRFKNEFCMESYLLTVPSVTYIHCIARLRLSSHNLNIELGRHAKPKVSVADRTCSRCNLGVVDDEMHFLIECPAFTTERNELFSVVGTSLQGFNTLDSLNKFISIMSSKCSEVTFRLGKFLHKCLPK